MKLPLDLPKRKDLRGDLAAGLTNGLVQIPDTMASAILYEAARQRLKARETD